MTGGVLTRVIYNQILKYINTNANKLSGGEFEATIN